MSTSVKRLIKEYQDFDISEDEPQFYHLQYHFTNGRSRPSAHRRSTLKDAVAYALRVFAHTGYKVARITLHNAEGYKLMMVDETSVIFNFIKENE